MTVRELSRSQRRLMDALVRDPDASNGELAVRLGCSTGYVEKLLHGVFSVYQVQTRTGACMAHARRRGPAVRKRDTATEPMGL